MICDKQKLDIKAESVDRHQIEQRAKFDHIERLKSALRVGEIQSGHRSNHQIDYSSALLASPWLMRSYQTAVERTRAECEIKFTALYGIGELRHFNDRRRKIGVRK